MDEWNDHYADLFAPTTRYDHYDVRFSVEKPPDELVSNIHLIARVPTGIIVCTTDQGWRFLPGGTREAGETIRETAERELQEEAGASLVGDLDFVGSFRAVNHSDAPWKPHLPYPVTHWAFAAVDVHVDGVPTNPADGEQVTEVLVLPPKKAADYLAEFDPVMAEVVRLAAARGVL